MQPDPSATETYAETQQMLSIRRTWMQRWWLFTLGLWLTVAPASLWSLRRTLQQLNDYFTWAAIRYGLAFNRLAAVGLGLCLGLTVALLVKQSRFILFGLTQQERRDLRKAMAKRCQSTTGDCDTRDL